MASPGWVGARVTVSCACSHYPFLHLLLLLPGRANETPVCRQSPAIVVAHRHRHPPPLSLCHTSSGMRFRPCAMAPVRTSPPLLRLSAPVTVAIACNRPLSRSTGLVGFGDLGFWVAGVADGRRRSAEKRESGLISGWARMRSPLFLLVLLISFPFILQLQLSSF